MTKIILPHSGYKNLIVRESCLWERDMNLEQRDRLYRHIQKLEGLLAYAVAHNDDAEAARRTDVDRGRTVARVRVGQI